MANKMQVKLTALSGSKLKEVDVKNVMDHVLYDTEQNCKKEHNGLWAMRLTG